MLICPDIAGWTIVLETLSQIQIHTQGWGPEKDSGINITSSSVSQGSIIYLRPDDIFQIGRVRLKLQREALETQENSKIQVTSSGCGGATADQQHIHQDGELKEALESCSNHRHSISTPHSSHDMDTAIMETPAASRYDFPRPNGSQIMFTAAENDTTDHGDYQKEEPQSNRPGIQTSIKEGVKRTEEIRLEESIPNKHSEENGYLSNKGLGEMSTDNLPAKELNSEPQKIEILPCADDKVTHKSTRDLSDMLLDLADSDQDGLSSLRSHNPELSSHESGDIEERSKHSGNSFIEAADISPQSPPVTTSKQSSRKRKRAADESQGIMRSLIHMAVPPSSSRAKYARQQSLDGESAKKGSVKKQSTKKKAIHALQDFSEPPLSSRSTRLSIKEGSTMSRSLNTKLRVFFASSTTVDKTSKFKNFLDNHGVTRVKSVGDCDILCIGNSDLKKTCNLVLAVISGKQVITEDWVVQSVTKGELLDHNGFLARDPVKEAEWETDLSEAIERGKQGIQPFLDFAVRFTPAAKKELGKGFTDLKGIAEHAGAKSVVATLPRKSSPAQAPKTIIIATPDDADLLALEEGGWRSFNKDIVTLSVLRGFLNVNSDEFLIRHRDGTGSGASKKRKR